MHRFAMMVLGVAVVLAEEPARVAYGNRPFANHEPVPALDQNHLFFHEGPNSLTLYETHKGAPVYTTSLKEPQLSGNARITGAALARDGVTAVGVAFLPGKDGESGGLAFLDPRGAQIRFAGTGRFMPCHVTYDARGSLWAFGFEVAAGDSDYAVARRFDGQGKSAGAFLMRSTFAPILNPFDCHRGQWTARTSNDRVGAMAEVWNARERFMEQLWVELDLDGKEIGRWMLGSEREGPAGGMAFTEDSRLFVRWRGQLLELDRKERMWRPAQVQRRGLLLGAEGNELVFTEGNGQRFVWVRP